MDQPYLLSEAQMRRIEPFFPLSHGIPRVDDRLIVSAIIFVIFYAGLSGVGEDGLPTGEFFDCNWMYRTAKANGAADHLPLPPFQALHAK